MKNKLTIENELDIMNKWGLTCEELFLIQLLFLAGSEEGHSELLIKYINLDIDKKTIGDILLLLQNKGIITKEYKIPKTGSIFDPEEVIFNKNFLKGYLKYSGDMGQELFDAYPHFVTINDSTYDIANYAKKFNNEEDFYYAYGKAIGWKESKHLEVLELIKWAKSYTNYLKFNICDFVISKAWNRIQELKDNKCESLKFDNNRIL